MQHHINRVVFFYFSRVLSNNHRESRAITSQECPTWRSHTCLLIHRHHYQPPQDNETKHQPRQTQKEIFTSDVTSQHRASEAHIRVARDTSRHILSSRGLRAPSALTPTPPNIISMRHDPAHQHPLTIPFLVARGGVLSVSSPMAVSVTAYLECAAVKMRVTQEYSILDRCHSSLANMRINSHYCILN